MENIKISRGGVQSDNVSPSENKHTKEDLKIMQAWNLETKIQVSQTRILEWYQKFDDQCYVSFSGGKDSTVLADLAARVCKLRNCKLVLWFSDTGLEYPEIREHVKTFPKYLEEKYRIEVELIMDYPKDRKGNRITFKQVIETYGYPIVSKEVSQCAYEARNAIKNGRDARALKRFNGQLINPKTGLVDETYFSLKKWKFLLDAPFKISHQCCNAMKKRPSHKFEKASGLHCIVGTMASESQLRKSEWLKHGCNAFDANNPKSRPLSFWMEQDVLEYVVKYDIPYASAYGEILQDDNGKYYTTLCERTGCVFCGFGCHLEKEPNRFQRLKETHPKLWKYCMKPNEEGGLGMRKVLEFIGVKVE